MCQLKPDFYINKYYFKKVNKEGIQIGVNTIIQNKNLKITIKYININIFNLDKNTYKEKNLIGVAEPINNLVLEKKLNVEQDIIITIYWKYLFIFLPLLFKKEVTLLVKAKVAYETFLKNGIEEIVEIKRLNGLFLKP